MDLLGCVETITITTNFTNLWALYAIHLKVSSLFWILISLDVICSPNNLFMTDTIVLSLLRWLYRILLYPRFIPFLYLPWVFHTDTPSYLGGMILNPCNFSITSTWLSSLSYALLYLQQLQIMILFLILLSQSAWSLCYHMSCWSSSYLDVTDYLL